MVAWRCNVFFPADGKLLCASDSLEKIVVNLRLPLLNDNDFFITVILTWLKGLFPMLLRIFSLRSSFLRLNFQEPSRSSPYVVKLKPSSYVSPV
jgi:hypothetical protein